MCRGRYLLSLLLIVCVASTSATNAAGDATLPQVSLRAGKLQGDKAGEGPGAVFKGIPFAQPPVGALRWREPVTVDAWEGVKEATSLGAACVQNGRDGVTGEEDCLHLNVWTAEWPIESPRPVMLWLFGGANAVGSASNPVFDGAALASHGVVVVTANFRVGAMGFMAHPALSAESAHRSSGNYTLLDQLMALRWIHDNIAQFGGDARRVTVFGQSSGAYDLLLLMTSPLARGLFAKAIAQSGQLLSYDGPMPKARAEDIGTKIAADLQAPADKEVLSYLRSLPAKQVVTTAAKWLPTQPGSDTGLLTNVDGWVLPERPARVFAEGRQMAIPLILGNNAREITPQASIDEIRQHIVATYGSLAPKALQAYGLADGKQGNSDPLLGGVGAQWWTDIVQRCAAIVETEWHATAKHPVWQYQFERSIPGREALGATHGAEVAFVFGTLDRVGPDRPAFTDDDRQASRRMQDYWTNFATSGDPNGPGLPNWPRGGDGQYLAFTAGGPVVKDSLQSRPCGVFREWTQKRLADDPQAVH